MKKWRIPAAIAILCASLIVYFQSAAPVLLQDTDTIGILRGIVARHSPLSWFVTDWPLENHFYRPVPTLFFEFDQAVHPGSAAGFGLTNALICACCLFALFWFVRELTDSTFLASGCAVLFLLWSLDWGGVLSPFIIWASYVVPVIGFVRHGLKVHRYLAAPFLLYFLATQVDGLQPLYARTIAWLPGRTATVMTFFFLVALAAYSRWERISARRLQEAATSLDKPTASRTTSQSAEPKHTWIWLLVCGAATLLAFASYEQAIMLPACLLIVAVYFRLKHYQVRWLTVGSSWASIPLYLALRTAVIPSSTSRYQNQQLRFGGGIVFDLEKYFIPNFASFNSALEALQIGFSTILMPQVYGGLLAGISTCFAVYQARRNWLIILTGFLLSAVAFLPMAWLKFFAHYHYLPMALRTIFVVGIAQVAWKLVSIAACPPERRAPERLSPALGSLPRR